MTPTTRTPEEKAAWAARMQTAKLAKASAKASAKADPPSPLTVGRVVPLAAAASEPSITRLTRHRPSAPAVGVPAARPSAELSPPSGPSARVGREASPVPALIAALESLPLDSVSYADCGLLLNALSSFTTAVGQRRRLAQEQHEASTLRAPCSTCGRSIDISKSGGYQILTERDEHYQPINRYYCSQQCLLAKNMPSHAKSAAKEKRA